MKVHNMSHTEKRSLLARTVILQGSLRYLPIGGMQNHILMYVGTRVSQK